MTAIDLAAWEDRFEEWLKHQVHTGDAAHGVEHFRRVAWNARRLAEPEAAALEVVLPAAWLHDCVVVPKDSPDRRRASRIAAVAAEGLLREWRYPEASIPEISHAIEAHSFTAGIPPRTAAARVVQDADRLDAIGAVGIARCLMLGAELGSPLYDPADPFCENRTADDRVSAIDHFYTKLLRLAGTMQTAAGRAEAEQRTAVLRSFLNQLRHELPVRSGSRVC